MGQGSSDDDAPARRSRRSWVLGVAAVVALVVAIGAGFLIGRSTAPGPAIVVAAGPVVEESPAASTLPVSGVLPSAAPTRPGLQVSVGARMPAVFSPAEGLADTAGVASGYRLTRGQVDGATLSRTLADAFGVAGDVGETSSGWQVGEPSDATSSSVTVHDDPLLTWEFADKTAADVSAQGASVPPKVARDVATSLLGGLGVDVGSIDWQVDRFAGLTRVTAWQTVKGARTQLSWVVDVGKDGAIVNASGFAAGLVEVPGYPVVGAATAVRRAALPTWSALGPTPVDGGLLTNATPSASAAATLNASKRPALRVPMADVVVTAADLGLAEFWQPDGDLLILPAYRLTGDDQSSWSLIAVTGIDVHFIDVTYPSATPTAT